MKRVFLLLLLTSMFTSNNSYAQDNDKWGSLVGVLLEVAAL